MNEKNMPGVVSRFAPRVAIPTFDKIMFIDIRQIIRCEADGCYTYFHLVDKTKIVSSRTLGTYDKILCQLNFLRVHQSHLVNVDHIDTYYRGSGGYVIMSDETMVEVSQRKKDAFLSKILG